MNNLEMLMDSVFQGFLFLILLPYGYTFFIPADQEDTKIGANFVCSEKHRAFFREHIGNSFSFDVAFHPYGQLCFCSPLYAKIAPEIFPSAI